MTKTLVHDVKCSIQTGESHDAANRLWTSARKIYDRTEVDRALLGKVFYDLRNLYSERATPAASRRSSGHGTFEAEVKKRKYDPRRVRELVADYEATQQGKPTTAAKQKIRREKQAADSKTKTQALKLPATPAGSKPHGSTSQYTPLEKMPPAECRKLFDAFLEGLVDDCTTLEEMDIPAAVRAYTKTCELSRVMQALLLVQGKVGSLMSRIGAVVQESGTNPPVEAEAELVAVQ